MAGILDGIRVLDFGRYVAGPACAMLLADYGAEVIRIEKIDGSEDRYTTPVDDNLTGTIFLQVNRNKKGMTLNPMKPEGQEVVKKLVATADVVIANLPPATLQAMGLDYESLKQIKEDIILTTNTAYGRGGPYSERVGFDAVAQAMSGAMYLSGYPEQPMRMAVPWVDFCTASLCAFGTMTALFERQRSGRGQMVEGALLATAMMVANPMQIEQSLLQVNRVATANRSQISGPSDAFKTQDGWILVSVVGNPLFARWAKLIGEEHWLHDERFKEDVDRGNHGEMLSARMSAWCAERSSEQALQELSEARIPASPVLSPQQALDDPHVAAKGMLVPSDYPGLPKPAPISDTPVKLSADPPAINSCAPTLGQHTDEIMLSLGYSQEEIKQLHEKRVI